MLRNVFSALLSIVYILSSFSFFMTYIMDSSDERLRELMRSLADTIGEVVNGNDDIRNTLSMMEQEGYPVDMIVASITMVTTIDEDESLKNNENLSYYDRSFLKKILVRFNGAQQQILKELARCI